MMFVPSSERTNLMKTFLLAGALAASFLAGCASQQVASMSATPDSEAGYMTVQDGKRHEFLVGSRLARESRENAEVTKTASRRAWREATTAAPSPTGPTTGGGM
jgi:Spy/CpxP family protein refolding chaperone